MSNYLEYVGMPDDTGDDDDDTVKIIINRSDAEKLRDILISAVGLG